MLGRVLNAVFAVFCLILIAILIVLLPFPFQLDPQDPLRLPDLGRVYGAVPIKEVAPVRNRDRGQLFGGVSPEVGRL